MNSVTTLSEIIKEQINSAVDNYRAKLEEYATELSVDAIKEIVHNPNFEEAQAHDFYWRADAITRRIVRTVQIHCPNSKDNSVEEVTLYYYRFGEMLTFIELEEVVKKLGGFRHAYFYEIEADNRRDPYFAETYPNATQRRINHDTRSCNAFQYMSFGWHSSNGYPINPLQDGRKWQSFVWFPLVRNEVL